MARHDPPWQPYASPIRDDSPDGRPTWVRWRILGMLMALVAMSHFNRASIAVFGTEVLIPKYGISETQVGFTYTTYLIIYTLCMLPGGWLIDRIGPKRALLSMGLGTAVLVSLTGLASLATPVFLLALLCGFRAMLGAVTAPLHPGAARVVSFWMTRPTQAAGNGMVTGAAVAGIAATPFVFGWLLDLWGWQGAFVVAGVVMLLLTLVWWLGSTDHPGQHQNVNSAERRLISAPNHDESTQAEVAASGATRDDSGFAQSAGGLHAGRPGNTEPPTWDGFLGLLANRSLVLLALSFAALGYVQYLFFYWLQYYFDTVLGLGKLDSRLYSTIPTVGMAVGMVGGGWLSGYVERLVGRTRGRAIVPVCGLVVCAAMLSLGLVVSQPKLVLACFTLSMAAIGCAEPGFWVTGIEMGGRRGGLSAAFLNTMGNAGGLLAPWVTPLFSSFFGWNAALALASVVGLVGALLWWWIDPDERIISPEEAQE